MSSAISNLQFHRPNGDGDDAKGALQHHDGSRPRRQQRRRTRALLVAAVLVLVSIAAVVTLTLTASNNNNNNNNNDSHRKPRDDCSGHCQEPQPPTSPPSTTTTPPSTTTTPTKTTPPTSPATTATKHLAVVSYNMGYHIVMNSPSPTATDRGVVAKCRDQYADTKGWHTAAGAVEAARESESESEAAATAATAAAAAMAADGSDTTRIAQCTWNAIHWLVRSMTSTAPTSTTGGLARRRHHHRGIDVWCVQEVDRRRQRAVVDAFRREMVVARQRQRDDDVAAAIAAGDVDADSSIGDVIDDAYDVDQFDASNIIYSTRTVGRPSFRATSYLDDTVYRPLQCLYFPRHGLMIINVQAPHNVVGGLVPLLERKLADVAQQLHAEQPGVVVNRVLAFGDFNDDAAGAQFGGVRRSFRAFGHTLNIPLELLPSSSTTTTTRQLPRTCCEDAQYAYPGDYVFDSVVYGVGDGDGDVTTSFFGVPPGMAHDEGAARPGGGPMSDHDPVALF